MKVKIRGEVIYLRTYQEGDEEHIIPLLNTHLSTPITKESWRWKYLSNPSGSLILLATTITGRIIGHVGLQRKRGWYNGHEHTFFSSEDTVVESEYRGHGLSGLFPKLLPNEQFSIIGFPNSLSYHSYKKFSHEYTKQLSHEEIPVLRKNIWVPFRTKRDRYFSAPYMLRNIAENELPLCDRLWEHKKEESFLGIRRDQHYLKWRLFQGSEKHTLYVIEKSGRVIGYFANTYHHQTCLITDILILNEYLIDKLLIPLIEKMCRTNRIRAIEILTSDTRLINAFSRAGYLISHYITANFHNATMEHPMSTPYITYSDTHLFS